LASTVPSLIPTHSSTQSLSQSSAHLRPPSPSIPFGQSKPSLSKPAPTLSVHPMITRSKAKHLSVSTPYALVSTSEPNSVQEAFLDPKWVRAMNEEYIALQRNQTWSLVPFSYDMNLIDCKWMFRVKYNSNGSVLKHKVRLVAKGFLQNLGVDYSETFSSVVKAPTIRVLFSLVVSFGWDIQ